MGKLYDDKGNRMSPSFSTKNGVRYRFYVSSALLRGRKAAAGSVGRIAADRDRERGPYRSCNQSIAARSSTVLPAISDRFSGSSLPMIIC